MRTFIKADLEILTNRGVFVAEFTFPKTAIAHAREVGARVWRVRVGNAIVASEGSWKG